MGKATQLIKLHSTCSANLHFWISHSTERDLKVTSRHGNIFMLILGKSECFYDAQLIYVIDLFSQKLPFHLDFDLSGSEDSEAGTNLLSNYPTNLTLTFSLSTNQPTNQQTN